MACWRHCHHGEIDYEEDQPFFMANLHRGVLYGVRSEASVCNEDAIMDRAPPSLISSPLQTPYKRPTALVDIRDSATDD